MFEKKHISASLRGFLALALLTLSLFFWPFLLLFFLFSMFFTSSCCIFFHRSSFYVLVIVSLVSGFLVFVLCYLLDLCFLFVVLVFFGGFKGQVRWPQGPPHLALNPPYLIYFVWVCFLFVLFFFAFGFLEGFKGQVRLPLGPPHLAVNPPY